MLGYASGVKEAKEAFVAGLEGTAQWEVLAIASALPLLSWQLSLAGSSKSIPSRYIAGDAVRGVAIATFLVSIVSFSLTLRIFYAISAVVCWRTFGYRRCVNEQVPPSGSSRPYFMSVFRSTMMLCTVTCILAVDFHVFPRRLAKTETFGTGLMDIGVGAFVVANGMVASKAQRKVPGAKVLRKVIPLVALGVLRLFTLKSIDYQEHVSEYGKHWNFFFTMAAVITGSWTLQRLLPSLFVERPGLAGIALYGAYELLLSQHGIEDYVLMEHSKLGHKASLLAQNKEGVTSSVGFLALHFALCALADLYSALDA